MDRRAIGLVHVAHRWEPQWNDPRRSRPLIGPGAIVARRFELSRKLGSGGSATVWEAIELSSQRKVAVKLLDPRLGASPHSAGYFQREGEVLAALDHPNVARAHEAGVDGQQPYLVMELVAGVPLEKVLSERAELDKKFTFDEVAALFEQLGGAVEHAHARGILHRDLKPANVFVDGDRLKVIDFGLAKIFEEGPGSEGTTRDRRLGSLAYMAPEQARGESVGPSADVFALGVILFELLTLRRPFPKDDVTDRMATEARPRTEILPQLDAILEKALAIDPAARFLSAATFVGAVNALLRPPQEPRRPSPAPWLGLAALVVLVLVLIAQVFGKPKVGPAGIPEPVVAPPVVNSAAKDAPSERKAPQEMR